MTTEAQPQTVGSVVAAVAFAEGIAAVIQEDRNKALEMKIRPRAKNRNWASSIPTCLRQGVYSITHWQDKKLHDAFLQARFDKGKSEETILITELMHLGYEIVETQVPIEAAMTEKYKLSGYIDGKVLVTEDLLKKVSLQSGLDLELLKKNFLRRRLPFEVKSMRPEVFARIKTLQDIKDDDFQSRNYRQMLIYLLGHNEEVGLMFQTDCLGHWRIIVVPLDYADAEKCLQAVEEINRHVAAKTLPERPRYTEKMCARCDWVHVCMPDVLNEARVVFKDDPEVEDLLERREAAKEARSEYEKVDKKIKEKVKGYELLSIGRFTITGKEIPKATYPLTEALKKELYVNKPYWKADIKVVGSDK